MTRKMIAAVYLFVAFSICMADFKPLPRINTVEDSPNARFVNTATGLDFMAVGSSYVNLWWRDGAPHHCNFTPALYDSEAARQALSLMRRSGYTMVRIFVDKGHPARNRLAVYGVDGPYETATPALYKPYMDNLVDFLTLATENRIYVVLSFEIWPYNKYYTSLAMSGSPEIEGRHNRTILAENTIKAKEIFLEEFVRYIYESNPQLLSTILAYDVQNELYCRSDEKPFSLTEGLVTTANGKTYDMADAASRQACQDDNTVNWAQRCIKAIKKYDPQALTTTSLFPFWPLKKTVNTGILPLDTEDKRWPVGMSVIIDKTDFDFVDIHPYIGWQGTMEQILNSSEWDVVDRTKKPVVAFEYGAHRYESRVPVDTVELAAQVLYDWRQQMFDCGFAGASLFTWHTTSHTRWTMTEENHVVNDYLSVCKWWEFNDENSPSRWTFNGKGWKFKQNALSNITAMRIGKEYKAEKCFNDTAIIFDFAECEEMPYLCSPWIKMNAFDSLAFKIELVNNSPVDKLTLAWIADPADNWQGSASQSFSIKPNTTEKLQYMVALDNNPDWKGQVCKIQISADGEPVNTGSVEISELGFINRIDE